MEIIGYLFAIIIGMIMGLIGGGGSILSVPIFVYVFGLDAVTATTYSLFVVGITSSIGSIGYLRQKLVKFKTTLSFGIPSVLGVLFSRRIVVPHLPHFIINRWGISLTKEVFLLLLFSILMIISSYKMIKKISNESLIKSSEINYTLLISQGLLVGLITGLIGAGGGFLIVPALVMLLKIEMKEAIATSLFIISINSLLGFFTTRNSLPTDWNFLSIFSVLSIIGIIAGIFISKKIDGKKLKPIFGWFVLAMGIYIIIKELIFK